MPPDQCRIHIKSHAKHTKALATNLGDDHAVLEAGVLGDGLAQLLVLGHQVLAVAAPDQQQQAQQQTQQSQAQQHQAQREQQQTTVSIWYSLQDGDWLEVCLPACSQDHRVGAEDGHESGQLTHMACNCCGGWQITAAGQHMLRW